ncbi:bone morphogenetic protein receptor type-2-like [Acanthaster planci]|uniref:receptor protein serine/threonine kinase n=1 Tax=Acanthaster planci TaxID=133434 RepID=A0A8B7Y5N4_ACAPL|nr:bone morphogenetic protein receptor type-2-like [Acanthaster planci]XP_022088503.1 bone morphogenetic protein receptor type-2-like [Acanthaster planci]
MAIFGPVLFSTLTFGLLLSQASGYICVYRNEKLSPVEGIEVDEVSGIVLPDNKSILCNGRLDSCFSLWYTRPSNGEIVVTKQGCWRFESTEHDCKEDECNSSMPPIDSIQRAHNVSSQFCCCKGDFCNANVSSSYVPVPHTKPMPIRPDGIVTSPPQNSESWTTIIVVMVCIFCLCVAVPVVFLACRIYRARTLKARMDHLGMLEAAPPEPSVDLDQVKVLNLIGQGRYCNCYRGMLEEHEVAVKIFAGASRQCYLNEVEIYSLAHIEHPNILKFVGSCERMGQDNWPEYLLVVEYMTHGSLMNYLKENTYDWLAMCRLSQTAAAGLAHLHQSLDKGGSSRPAIVHRDINSRNILVKSDLTCVIGDFGFAMKVFGSSVVRDGDEDNSTITDVGTVRYMSPEVLDGAVNLRDCESALKQVDIYALGLVLWEIGTRCSDLYPGGNVPPYKLPFADELCQHPTFEDMQVHVSRGRKRPAFPDAWKENNQALRSLKETIEDCWDHDSEARLTALCVEERIIELMVLWNKHRTVSPTINATSEGTTVATLTQTRVQPDYSPGMTTTTVDSAAAASHHGQSQPQHTLPQCDPATTLEGSEGFFGSRCAPTGSVVEKNERQRLLSPDTISTSLSAQSDLNLIDLSSIAPSVDPKNLHYSDENIERYTSDLKYSRPYSTPTESSEGYGYSEPNTSPSKPLVMHEMRPSLAGDQMTDNLGVWSRRHNLHRPTSLPVWGQMTVNEARARSHPGHSLTELGGEQRPAKPNVNKQWQQALVEQAPVMSPKQNLSPREGDALISDNLSSSNGSCSSLHSTLSEGSANSCESDHSRRPNTLPLPSNSHGSKKKLVAVYIPDSGPTTKVQTGIAKMDSVNTQCHPVKVATNATHCKSKPGESRATSRARVQPSDANPSNTRPLSWSVGDKSNEESDSGSLLNGNSKSKDCELSTDSKKSKRKVTPYRIPGTKKLSVYNGQNRGSVSSEEASSPESGHTSDSSESSANNNSGDQCNGIRLLTQNGHALQPGGKPVTNGVTSRHLVPAADSTFQLGGDSTQYVGSGKTGVENGPRANYQVSCV